MKIPNRPPGMLCALMALFLPLLMPQPARGDGNLSRIGQYVVSSIDTQEVSARFLEPDIAGEAEMAEKLDNLVSSWYINNIFLPADPVEDYAYHRQLVPHDSVVIQRLRKAEEAVKLSFNGVVRSYIEMYMEKRPRQVEIMIGLTSYYYPLFEEILDRHGLPLELKNLAIIESALNPRAVSRAGAVGLWQIMYGTGKGLNLEITTLVDERRDVLKATDAAARYLKQLWEVYRDWHLVIAAYNCGPGNVNKAIARAGGKTNYWDIYFALPRETRGYVPAYIAATYMMNYYRVHGLSPQMPSIALNTDTVMVGRYLNLKQISDNLGMELEALRDLNPMYRHDIIPGTPEKTYPLRVPTDQLVSFIQKADIIYSHERNLHFPDNTVVKPRTEGPEGSLAYGDKTRITYTVKSGDNPGYISRWFNVSLTDLKRWNKISRNIIRTGQRLAIYVPSEYSEYYRKISTLSFSAKQALVGKRPKPNGERLQASAPAGTTVKAQEGTPPSSGETAAAKVQPAGQSPSTGQGEPAEGTVTQEAVQPPENREAMAAGTAQEYEYYTVRKGDNLWTIARNYPGVTNKDLMRLNNITDARRLRAGQKLKIRPKG